MLYAVILAGGSGTRLWPRSREQKPKQFLDIVSERTMLQEAVDRITPLIPLERVYVVTNREYLGIVRQQIPGLPPQNAIGEIAARGTAAAIGLAAIILRQRDAEATMVVLTADHSIKRTDEFRACLSSAARVAARGHLVTLGINPAYPETGYGYIGRGDLLYQEGPFPVYRVERFTEKPDRATAEGFLASGRYSWNSGMFVWRVADIMAEIQRLMPRLYQQLQEIGRDLGTQRSEATLGRVWPQIERQTIDFGVMERARDVVVVPADIGWSDVGSWAALLDLLPADEAGNVIIGDNILLETANSLVYSRHRAIVTLGLQGMIIVDTGDVTLICPRERSQEVRLIVEWLKRNGHERYVTCMPDSENEDG